MKLTIIITFQNDIINACTNLSDGDTIVLVRLAGITAEIVLIQLNPYSLNFSLDSGAQRSMTSQTPKPATVSQLPPLINSFITYLINQQCVIIIGIENPGSQLSPSSSPLVSPIPSQFSLVAHKLTLNEVLVMVFSAIAFAYLRQMLDPTSAANSFRAPNAGRVGDYPSHYNPPYNTYGAPPAPPYYGQQTYGGYNISAPPYEGKPGYMPSDNKNDDPFGDTHEHGSGSRV